MTQRYAREPASSESCDCAQTHPADPTTLADHQDPTASPYSHLDTNHQDYLPAPKGSISSTQVGLKEKQHWLYGCHATHDQAELISPQCPEHIRAYTLTFNYYETIPTAHTITSIIPQNAADFDLYCFSFQECGSYVKNPPTVQQLTVTVVSAINAAANKNNTSGGKDSAETNYKIVAIHNLQSLYTIVVARISLHDIIHHVQTQTVTTGFMDVVGNKVCFLFIVLFSVVFFFSFFPPYFYFCCTDFFIISSSLPMMTTKITFINPNPTHSTKPPRLFPLFSQLASPTTTEKKTQTKK